MCFLQASQLLGSAILNLSPPKPQALNKEDFSTDLSVNNLFFIEVPESRIVFPVLLSLTKQKSFPTQSVGYFFKVY